MPGVFGLTGTELHQLRYGYAMGSARKLAARVGCHPCTIYRNEKRLRVSTFLLVRIDGHPTAAAFMRGMMRERNDV